MKSREEYADELTQKEERIQAWEHSNSNYETDKSENARVDYWYVD